MKKKNKRRIILLILLLLFIITMIIALANSRANKLIDVTAIILDNDKLIEDETVVLQAVNEEAAGHSITLPVSINEKTIDSYIFINEDIAKTEEINAIANTENATVNIAETDKETTENVEQPEKIEAIDNNSDKSVIEKKPGEKIYLSKEEIDSKIIKLIVKYDYIEKEGKRLYKKELSQDTNKVKVNVKGYMPLDSKVKVTEVEKGKVEEKINSKMEDPAGKINLTIACDIKIISEEKEYEPEEFDENVMVSISGFDEKEINVWHVKDNDDVEKMEVKSIDENKEFETNTFSTYGIEVIDDGKTTDAPSTENTDNPEKNQKEDQTNENNSENNGENNGGNQNNMMKVIRASESNSDEVLIIDDYNSDYNYYIGKNYTDNAAGSNSGAYTNSNLAKVTVNYYGYGYVNGQSDSTKKGRLSVSETEDIVRNIRCAPISNGKVSIELMDNPFMDKPGGYGFGGWKSTDGTISTDSNTKRQTIEATASMDMTINVYVNWQAAKVVYVNPDEGGDNVDTGLTEDSPFGSWGKACEYLYNNSTDRNNRELNIIVLTGQIDTGINYSRATTKTQVTTVTYNPSTTFSSGNTYILATGQGSGSNSITANGTGVTNTSLSGSTAPSNSTQWIITSSGSGYTIRSASNTNYYLAPNNGNNGLTLRTSQFVWTYSTSNRRFYYTSGNKTYYIRYSNNNGWYVSTSTNNAMSFYFLTFTSNTEDRIQKANVASNDYYSTSRRLALTVTSLYNGADYRDDASIDLTDSSAQADFDIVNDFQMNHVTIDSSGYTSNNSGTVFTDSYAWLTGNDYNVRLGRGIECSDTSSSGCVFANVIGGGVTSNSSSAKYNLVVESGKYSSIQGFNRYGASSYSYDGTVGLILGNDIDRAKRINDKMSVYYRTTINSGSGSNGTSTNEKAWIINVKSGKYGTDFFDANINSTNNDTREDCAYSGIYMGGYGTSSSDSTRDKADRYMIVEGGVIANAIGGLKTTSGTTVKTKMYIKGGEMYNVVGGAGLSTTYGNRILQVTGGTIDYSISGGSNGYASTGSGQEGKIENCNTLVYIGGTAQIGATANVNATPIASLYNVEAGCVLGAGNGKSGITDTGRVDNTHIIINGDAHILNSIYGGGNIGTVGASNGTSATAVIDILGGTIDKNVYGGSNSNNIYGSTTINMKGGQVKGAIYGGANSTGTIYSGSSVNVTGGTLGTTGNTSGVLFGGGKGRDTVIMQNATVNIADGDGNVNIYGNSYGGSEQGSVTGQVTVNYNTVPSIVSGNTYMITYNNTNMLAIYGGTSITNETRSTTATPSNNALWTITASGNKYTIYNAAANKYLCSTTSSDGWWGTTVNLGLQDQPFEWSYDSGNKRFYTSVTTSSWWGGESTSDYYLRYNNGWSVNTSTSNTSLTFQTYTVQADAGGTVVNINDNPSVANTINIVGNVFAGAQGTAQNQASISGNATINVDGSNLPSASIFGGNDVNGVTNGNITVNIGNTYTSKVRDVYGGGNEDDTGTEADNVKVYLLSHADVTNAYNGGKSADLISTGSSDTTRAIYLQGGTAGYIFGGSNTSGTVTASHVYIESGTATEVYGGNNQGGTVNESFVIVNGGTVATVYGGNNQGGTTLTSNVNVNAGTVTDAYGGGNNAVTNLTNITVNGNVGNNVFGGGNMAGVTTNTNVLIRNATIGGSAFGGGNGVSAIVNGNTNITLHGTTNNVTGSVFGGGNQAATGTEQSNNSTSTVNIAGGKIGGNVYGGANTSVVYGNTVTNIGKDAIGNQSLETGEIEITGTVFGGGEANAAGSEVYDFSFISVTQGTEINIDANEYSKFIIRGSIFGSGNASSSAGDSYINIKNYGTPLNPRTNVSLQRATLVTIDNSSFLLNGTTDRTNEYSSVFFSISRVNEIKMRNNSTLYLANGANLLKKLDSVAVVNGVEEKGAVTIDEETGENTKNVDNRIYMLEGKNLNIATNEQATAYGQVSGMFFLGLFTNRANPATSTGYYNAGYENGDEITNFGTFANNSYVMAEHYRDSESDESIHDITVDGFYTNINEEGTIKKQYVGVTPDDDIYYIWLVGEKFDVTTFEMSLMASKYATLGTYELLLQGFSDPNIRFTIQGFSAGLAEGVSLVDPSQIQSVEPNQTRANNVFGLTMKTGNMGWRTNSSTTFLTQDGGTYTGRREYLSDSSTYTPTLNFCFYHSQNIDEKKALGDVTIRFQVQTPIDDLNYKISIIDINITLTSQLFQDTFYEAAITPGQEFRIIYINRNINNK